ncbi:PIN domain-like protein [Paraphaeosphaeria sporulosa]|uniref:PIN domain-like protein n=1 Tax=Paraphaeosphaeria sporulosa TaxID=1460663 RepID=A0A177CHK6_9PLEO|nr:PIN domain-like protein [Paraphaeosphaeria sporulosa]OAG06701.1 PIN domain-like protein [Paraphaeosphaeria sporulosa]
MGVTGLWTVLQPCARPIKIETLNKKRLAVDASIWIYQFLKAVRDKEGNALRNSHIVGFFRRICKLLFFGIKPVFVFDGGAPALKRQTINNRKSRREGRREDAVRTAGKLLAMQMQRVAEEEEKKRKEASRRPRQEVDEEEEIPEDLVYAEEVIQTQQERLANRTFKRKDQYHLPDLGTSIAEMGGADDPRIMSLEELEHYARQFDSGEDINVYDFSKIDFDGAFFTSLPDSDRYNILNAARLRSRLRLGYSKEQLDVMFPDRMAFSRFQIERVKERNDLTQRLMNINGMVDDSGFGAGAASRVASDKAREYVLVKNDSVEGGWALGVVTNRDEGKANKPIDVDNIPVQNLDEDDEWEEEDEFEDVPIEGLNRLPKPPPGMTVRDREAQDFISEELTRRRRKFYASRKVKSSRPTAPRPARLANLAQDPDSLFLAPGDEQEQEWEDALPVDEDDAEGEPAGDDEEERQLQQAIAMSMQHNGTTEEHESEEEDIYREVFQQERAKETNPFAGTRGSGMAIARLANQRANKVAPVPRPFTGSDSEDDGIDLQAALAESRKSKQQPTSTQAASRPPPKAAPPAPNPKPVKSTNAPGFDGPLPFERLNLGNSLLGKKKMEKLEAENAGGFEKDTGDQKTKEDAPLPPWFSGGERNIEEELKANREEAKKEWEQTRKEQAEMYQFQELPRLRKHDTHEVVDLEAEGTHEELAEVLTVQPDDDDDAEMEDVVIVDSKLHMGDLADKVRAEPPQPPREDRPSLSKQGNSLLGKGPFAEDSDEPIEWSESEPEDERRQQTQQQAKLPSPQASKEPSKSPSPEFEDVPIGTAPTRPTLVNCPAAATSPSPEFEDVPIEPARATRRRRSLSPFVLGGADELEAPIVPYSGTADDNAPIDIPDDGSDQYSDPEDAELFASLAAEGEEHARFAQELTNSSRPRVNFDEELKQLRAQQKKDRRDADEVTQTMVAECQHLLTLFGLPYITAPMEAEAQCVELVHLGLVDGIVTDDSDTFLFGGTRVYKNMFNAAKFVECYLASDLSSEFALTREKLIDIAQLLGSDYTTGIPGIGPVTALELLSEFENLPDFREWWDGVQGGTIPKDADKNSQFRRRFRRSQATKLFLPPGFPDPRVKEAYLKPEVDSDPMPFQWGMPDLDALRSFLSSQIGWSAERTDEVLVPVIKDMARREKEGTQSNLTRFFEGGVGAGAFAPRVRGAVGEQRGKGAAGKRLGAALTRLAQREKGGGVDVDSAVGEGGQGGQIGEAEIEADGNASTHGGMKRRRRGGKKAAAEVQDEVGGQEDGDEDEAYLEPMKKRTRKTRKKY